MNTVLCRLCYKPTCRDVESYLKLSGQVEYGGQNLPQLAEIGLTDLPKAVHPSPISLYNLE